MFARVENSCKKKENNRKKRVFLLDKRLELWYNIYSVKRKGGGFNRQVHPSTELFSNEYQI